MEEQEKYMGEGEQKEIELTVDDFKVMLQALKLFGTILEGELEEAIKEGDADAVREASLIRHENKALMNKIEEVLK